MRASALGMLGCFVALLAVGAEAPSRISDLQLQVDPGNPPRVEVRGAAQLPDNAILNISLKNECSDIQGKHWKLLDMKRISVKGEGFETVFTPPALPFGPYHVEVDCDRERQYPSVKIAEGSGLHAERSFKVDFNDDIAAPCLAFAETLKESDALCSALEQARKGNAGKTGDAARLKAFNEFLSEWSPKVSQLTAKYPQGQEELLYPHTRSALDGLTAKLSRFADLYTSELKGEKNKTQADHPNWFEPDVPAELVLARRTLAAEFAFNVGKKVIDFGYDRATDLLKDLKAGKASANREWTAFRTAFRKDLDRCKAGQEALASGYLRTEISTVASDAPALYALGQQLLEAIDQEAASPGQGAGAILRAKEGMIAAYKALTEKVGNAAKPPPPAK